MPHRKGMTRAVAGLAMVVIMSTAGPASAQSNMNVSDIKAELSRMRVLYTDEHPDVQRLVRHLKKAQELDKERSAKKQNGKPAATQPPAAQESPSPADNAAQSPAKKWVTQQK